jgi:ABC-2 type transport system permease protein
MHNTYLVLKHEIKTTLAKRSFWLTTFVFPLLIMGFTLVPQLMVGDVIESSSQAALTPPPGVSRTIGYVDPVGIVQSVPSDLPAGLLRRFEDEADAQLALHAGDIMQYYVIPATFLDSGQVLVVTPQSSFFASFESYNLMEYVVDSNLLGDAALARLAMAPTAGAEVVVLAPKAAERAADPEAFGATFLVMFILFFTITLSSGYMLQSVVKEKENRTAEVLLLSVRPLQLMLGKIVGLGLLALLQMVVWLGGGMLVLGEGQSLMSSAASISLSPELVIIVVLYFLLGYLLYASALGALGALAPNVREGSQFTFALILPLLIPLWLNQIFVQDPNGRAATFLSVFPLTAPTAMVTRLVAGGVPLWQPLVGLVILALSSLALVLLAARFFRADTLLSAESLNLKRLRRELRELRVGSSE